MYGVSETVGAVCIGVWVVKEVTEALQMMPDAGCPFSVGVVVVFTAVVVGVGRPNCGVYVLMMTNRW